MYLFLLQITLLACQHTFSFSSESLQLHNTEPCQKKVCISLGGGFNPFEKNWSNWIISPGRGENKKYVKPPPSTVIHSFNLFCSPMEVHTWIESGLMTNFWGCRKNSKVKIETGHQKHFKRNAQNSSFSLWDTDIHPGNLI